MNFMLRGLSVDLEERRINTMTAETLCGWMLVVYGAYLKRLRPTDENQIESKYIEWHTFVERCIVKKSRGSLLFTRCVPISTFISFR